MPLLISIIIPAFNAERYLSECLDSIVNQIDKSVEVIIIDDGSTDSTGVIADSYALNYNFIKVIHQSNKGVSGARNRAIDSSVGQYLVFLDSDDILYDNFFWKVTELIMQQPDIIEINASLTNKEGKVLNDKLFAFDVKNDGCSDSEIAKKRLSIQSKYYLFTRIIKKSLVKSFSFDEDINFCEDALYLTECYFKADKILTIDESLYGYRQHDNNVTIVKTVQNIDQLARLYNVIKRKVDSSENQNYKKYLLLLLLNMTHRRKSMYALEFKKIGCDNITVDQIKDIKDHYAWLFFDRNNDIAWIRRFSIVLPRLSNSLILLKSYIKCNRSIY